MDEIVRYYNSHTNTHNMLKNTIFNPFFYWTIIYNNSKSVVQRDLIPELFKLMDFNQIIKYKIP